MVRDYMTTVLAGVELPHSAPLAEVWGSVALNRMKQDRGREHREGGHRQYWDTQPEDRH